MTHKCILIVEDEPDARETLKLVFEIEGFSVATAENGREALAHLQASGSPCLILLDLMMPVMNGWEFLDELGRDHRHVLAKVPIVIVSATEFGEKHASIGYRFMKKPLDISPLLSIAKEHCGA